ncbi:siderophore-interacting protein [Aquabacter cavernae]|uniref:siderophore-interacting protein n=1 Tax=Aquabacter cavernae TaxID=2496029 RepID=UPI000F8DD4B7|nr:siderophore-interacting protein [Aquabacter cavernae]
MTDLSSPSVVPPSGPRREIVRVRHELKRRTLRVVRTHSLSPRMLRVTLAGPDLAGFTSLGFDDHVKLFFPATDGNEVARDYTPRRFDPQALELDIDFALHQAGPATAWALQAQAGQEIVVGGPRGSFVVPPDFDWHLLAGDETALPAMGRRLSELPEGARAFVFAEVDGPQDRITLESRAAVEVRWLYRGETGPDGLADAVRGFTPPPGDGHGWGACEAAAARGLREAVAALGLPKAQMRVSAYWKRGAVAFHEEQAG